MNLKKINNYKTEITFITLNIINGVLLRLNTVNNTFRLSPFLFELGFLMLLTIPSYYLKKEKKNRYYLIVTIILTIICIINSIYYNYYKSFASLSILANLSFAGDVSDAIIEKVLKPTDLIYILSPILLFISIRYLNKDINIKTNKNITKKTLISVLIIFIMGFFTMPLNAWGRLYKLWNREAVVMNFGIYVYEVDDLIQSLTPKITSLFGHDNALKKATEYYKENKYKEEKNEYTNIFKGKNILVIHAESLQTFPMELTFNGKEVTPNLNKLANEGIYFNNFYSEVGVGTSSDSEFTFNTSLMPSTKGTVFVNYFNRDYVAVPNLLKEKGYYTFSMHANEKTFWNREAMYKSLDYDDFYSKDSYIIDETIGLGLSDKSFFNQSVEKIKKIKAKKEPYYGVLITLSNHTPFNDLELIEDFDTSISLDNENKTITRNYLEGTTMDNYLKSVHYADAAIGEFIKKLDSEGLLDNTVIIIYGDHDARLSLKEFNLLYNYDPVQDKVKTEEDEGYIQFNKYNYEINRKVPLIVWTKSKKYNIVVDVPMGMIDVLPTIGNMIGIHSDFQLGKDIFSISEKDNTVVFVNGSYLTSKIYYNSPKGEIYPITNEPVSEDYVKIRTRYANKIIELSNDIIMYNLTKELKEVCSE